MAYQLHFNLQQRATLSAAISFWDRKEMKDKISTFVSCCSRNCDTRDEWQQFVKVALNEWKKNALPPKLEGELIHTVKAIGEKIYKWYRHVIHINYTGEMYWTSYGVVDEEKIFKLIWLNNPSLNAANLYNIACKYALKEDIDSLWQKIPKEIQDNRYRNLYKFYDRRILAYWEYVRDGNLPNLISYFEPDESDFKRRDVFNLPYYDSDLSTEENMLRLSVHEGYYIAVKYFWKMLTEEQKNKNVLSCAHTSVLRYIDHEAIDHGDGNHKTEKYVEICVFMMNQMTADHKKSFFNGQSLFTYADGFTYKDADMKAAILSMLLSAWPWQRLIGPVLNDMKQYLEDKSEAVRIILDKIARKMVKGYDLGCVTENSYYQSILQTVWRTIPGSVKQNIPLVIIMDNLLYALDLSSIKLILNDPEIAAVRDQYIESGGIVMYKYLITTDRYETLNQFFDEIFESEEKKKCLRQKIDHWNFFIIRDEFHLADKLLDWQCDTPDEREHLKDKINHIKLCEYFINKGQYDLVNKFINWKFKTKKQRKKCKDYFRNKISKIWSI